MHTASELRRSRDPLSGRDRGKAKGHVGTPAAHRFDAGALLVALFTRASHRRDMAHLALLDDRLLRDIGLTRGELYHRR